MYLNIRDKKKLKNSGEFIDISFEHRKSVRKRITVHKTALYCNKVIFVCLVFLFFCFFAFVFLKLNKLTMVLYIYIYMMAINTNN